MARHKLNSKGVSLVEALVASLIMVIGALMLMSGFLASAKLMERSRQLETSGQRTTGSMNRGIGGGANFQQVAAGDITIEIDRGKFKLVIEGGKIQKYTSTDDEGVSFYRFVPLKP